jgi:hypothetical protein
MASGPWTFTQTGFQPLILFRSAPASHGCLTALGTEPPQVAVDISHKISGKDNSNDVLVPL